MPVNECFYRLFQTNNTLVNENVNGYIDQVKQCCGTLMSEGNYESKILDFLTPNGSQFDMAKIAVFVSYSSEEVR